MKSVLATNVQSASQVRKMVQFIVPELKFKVKKVSFQDLARGECFFVTSTEWTPETFKSVKEGLSTVKNAIVSA